jgi:hypothetical protein
MLNAAKNTPKSSQKATNCSGTKNGKSSKEIRLSWYQSLDTKHICAHVNLNLGCSSRSQEKWSWGKVKIWRTKWFAVHNEFQTPSSLQRMRTSLEVNSLSLIPFGSIQSSLIQPTRHSKGKSTS